MVPFFRYSRDMVRRSQFLALAALSIAASVTACQASVEGHAVATGGVDAPPGVAVQPGPTPKVAGNDASVHLAAGTFHGDLLISGNHNRVTGAGAGKTIVEGRLKIAGNGNTVSGLTITEAAAISGNGNDSSGAEVRGQVTVGGNDNTK
jgi:hypothetical protein